MTTSQSVTLTKTLVPQRPVNVFIGSFRCVFFASPSLPDAFFGLLCKFIREGDDLMQRVRKECLL